MLGFSQKKLGEVIGLTFQQVGKYEYGTNKIGASRLHELSQVLDVPVSFFFDDTDPAIAPAIGGFAMPPDRIVKYDLQHTPETLEFISAYFAIEDATVRRRLLDFMKVLARK